jgi:hypothetical protein
VDGTFNRGERTMGEITEKEMGRIKARQRCDQSE